MDNLSDLKKIILETLAECTLTVRIISFSCSSEKMIRVSLLDCDNNVLLEDEEYLPS